MYHTSERTESRILTCLLLLLLLLLEASDNLDNHAQSISSSCSSSRLAGWLLAGCWLLGLLSSAQFSSAL